MFGGHGHSHGGKECDHGHGHNSGRANIGFGDDDDTQANKPMMNPDMMMMQKMMMANAMRANQMKSENKDATNIAVPVTPNPMMMMNQEMSPEMMEMAKEMFEQRQKLMKEYEEKGGKSNPEALHEMMAKAQQMNKNSMAKIAEMRSKNEGIVPENAADSQAPVNIPNTNPTLLNESINNSKLDDIINNKNTSAKKAKNEQEALILDAISRKDYSNLTAVKATQYGVLDHLKSLIESNQVDPYKPDEENVYLLHWAAINNRLEIAKYLVGLNCDIDPIGGELESSPLNWAARSGHIQMVVYLMQQGANPHNYDIEGFSTIHLSTMFGHSMATAYLLAKGLDPDIKDKNGATALMFAAQRIHSRDPAQLLITFNSRLNAQDNKGNTPLHYCVAYNNSTVMKILLEKGASLDVKNNKGLNPIEFSIDRGKGGAAKMMQISKDDDRDKLPGFIRSISKNKDTRKLGTRIYPFFLLFYIGLVFEANITWISKSIFIAALYGISYLYQMIFFDKNVLKYIPIATTLSFIFWLYTTYILYFSKYVADLNLFTGFFIFSTSMSWYNLYKAYKSDPGVLTSNREQMSQTIIKFVEQEAFSLDQFCTACIIRKPLRSKHCADCDRCVAKFDHHCPWVDNCIGQANLKYFIGFVFWTPMCLAYFIHGAIIFFSESCLKANQENFANLTTFKIFLQFMQCSPWVAFFTIIAAFNLFWITCLCICHIYQAVFIGLTTNERMNLNRYTHFSDKEGNYHNPFHFGIIQNFADLLDTNFCFLKPSLVNWKKEHDIQDLINSRLDKKKDKYNYQIV